MRLQSKAVYESCKFLGPQVGCSSLYPCRRKDLESPCANRPFGNWLSDRQDYRSSEGASNMPVMTGLSGNEMYCLHQKGLQAGDMVIGNSVFSVGFIGGIGSGLRTLAGGEVTQ